MNSHLTAMMSIKTILLRQLKENRKTELELAESYGNGDLAKDFHYSRAASYSRRILKMEDELRKFKKKHSGFKKMQLFNVFGKTDNRSTSADYRQTKDFDIAY